MTACIATELKTSRDLVYRLTKLFLARHSRDYLTDEGKALAAELEKAGVLLKDTLAPNRLVGPINPQFKIELIQAHTQTEETEPA